jgi:hypothetical protein
MAEWRSARNGTSLSGLQSGQKRHRLRTTRCRSLRRSFISGKNQLTHRTQSAVDNTPSHACGYRFGYVVHRALSYASQVCAPIPCRDQDGEGQVAESIAELAVRRKYVTRTELARRVRLPVPPRLHGCCFLSFARNCGQVVTGE